MTYADNPAELVTFPNGTVFRDANGDWGEIDSHEGGSVAIVVFGSEIPCGALCFSYPVLIVHIPE